MPKMCAADKVVAPKHRPETQTKREGIPKPVPVVPQISVPSLKDNPIIPTRKEQGRAGAGNKITRPKSQPIPWP